MTVEEVQRRVRWSWEELPDRSLNRRVEEALVVDGISSGAFQEPDNVGDMQRTLLPPLIAGLHRFGLLDSLMDKEAKNRLLDALNLPRTATNVLIVGTDLLHIAQVADYLAATFAKTTMKKVSRVGMDDLLILCKDKMFGEDTAYRDVLSRGLIILENAASDTFLQDRYGATVTTLLQKRLLAGRPTVFTVPLYFNRYYEALKNGEQDVLATMMERGASKAQPVLPYIMGDNTIWVLLT